MAQPNLNWFDRLMISVSFAESGEYETAVHYLDLKTQKNRKTSALNTKKASQDSNRPQMRL